MGTASGDSQAAQDVGYGDDSWGHGVFSVHDRAAAMACLDSGHYSYLNLDLYLDQKILDLIPGFGRFAPGLVTKWLARCGHKHQALG